MSHKPHLIQFDSIGSMPEGYITSTQTAEKIPFAIKRVFWTYDTPMEVVRGRHAHINTAQVLIALNGAIEVKMDNGLGTQEIIKLENPTQGLYLPPMYWATIYFTTGAILMSLASSNFDEADYIRDYQEFTARAQERNL